MHTSARKLSNVLDRGGAPTARADGGDRLRSRSVGGPKSQMEKTEDLLKTPHLRCHKQAGAGHCQGHGQQQSADSEYHSFASVPADYEFRFQSALVLH